MGLKSSLFLVTVTVSLLPLYGCSDPEPTPEEILVKDIQTYADVLLKIGDFNMGERGLLKVVKGSDDIDYMLRCIDGIDNPMVSSAEFRSRARSIKK